LEAVKVKKKLIVKKATLKNEVALKEENGLFCLQLLNCKNRVKGSSHFIEFYEI